MSRTSEHDILHGDEDDYMRRDFEKGVYDREDLEERAHEKAKTDVCDVTFWRDQFDTMNDSDTGQTYCTVAAAEVLARCMSALPIAIYQINVGLQPGALRSHIDALTTALSQLQKVALADAERENLERQ